MRLSIPALFILLCIVFAGCHPKSSTDTTIPYPQTKPGNTPEVFLKDLVSTDSLEFNACFSPDGKSYYFSRYEIHDIYVTHWDGNQWTQPEVTPFSEKEYLDADPAFGPDGNLYFISTRPRNETDSTSDFDIWFTTPLPNGGWSTARNLESVNSDSSEFYVSFAGNGNLYFASAREGGFGSFDIYVSELRNNKYQPPANLGQAINAPELEHDPFISQDEKTLFFTSVNREDGYGRGDIYISRRDESGKWSPAKNLGEPINSDQYEFCSYISPDGLYFFFTRGGDVQWIKLNTALND